MYTTDHDHPIFTAATVSELQQHLQELRAAYDGIEGNQSYRILRRLNELSRTGKGLRLDTKYGLASFANAYPDSEIVHVRFDGDFSTTGVSIKSINTFWFEME